jgi:hypothetical protein
MVAVDRSLGTRLGTEPTIGVIVYARESRARGGFGVLLEINTTRLLHVVSSVREGSHREPGSWSLKFDTGQRSTSRGL